MHKRTKSKKNSVRSSSGWSCPVRRRAELSCLMEEISKTKANGSRILTGSFKQPRSSVEYFRSTSNQSCEQQRHSLSADHENIIGCTMVAHHASPCILVPMGAVYRCGATPVSLDHGYRNTQTYS